MTEVLSQDEIDQLLTAISAGEIATEEVHQPTDQRKIKIYDFKRPDKFSKDQIRTVSIMHETFARLTTTSLSAQLRSLVHVHVASVDQLTYEEFIRSIPNPTTLAVINMDPLKGSAILEIDPAITFSIIDRLFGGPGGGGQVHPRAHRHRAVGHGGDHRADAGQPARGVEHGHRPAAAPGAASRPTPSSRRSCRPSEMVVLVTLETKVGEVEGMMNLCIPYLTIEPIISKLSAQYWYSSVRRGTTTENLNILRDRLSTRRDDPGRGGRQHGHPGARRARPARRGHHPPADSCGWPTPCP